MAEPLVLAPEDSSTRLLRECYDQLVADWLQIDQEWGTGQGGYEDDELISEIRQHLSLVDGDGWWVPPYSGGGWHHYMRDGLALCGRASRDGERPTFIGEPPAGRTCPKCQSQIASR